MADVTSFPTITTRVRVHGLNALSFKCAETITAGMVVDIDNDGNIVAGNSADTKVPIGVADTNGATNETITVNTIGTICYVANEDDTTAIGEGTTLAVSDTDGTVVALAGGADSDEYLIGLALTDISGDGWGLCLIRPQLSTTA
jgi:hypothetical protein